MTATLLCPVSPHHSVHAIVMWDGFGWKSAAQFCRFNPTALSEELRYKNLTVVDCSVYGTIAVVKV